MKHLRKTLGILLRLAIAFAIIAYLLTRKEMDFDHSIHVVAGAFRNWPWLLGGMVCLFLALFIGVIRWRLILEAQGIHLSLGRAFCIFFVGQFFNAFMMGSTGGDVVKALYASRETHHKKTEAIATVIADRIIGIAALFALGGAMMIIRFPFFAGHPKTQPLAILMAVMIVFTTVALPLLFSRHLFERWPFLGRLEKRFAFGTVLRKSYDSFYLCRTQHRLLATTFTLSLANHLLSVVACYCLGLALQVHNPFVDYLTLIPIILAVASLPITPGGLGVREGAAVNLLGAAGVQSSQALPLSLMIYIGSTVWSLFGGIIFLFYPAGTTGTTREIQAEIELEEADEPGRDVNPADKRPAPPSSA